MNSAMGLVVYIWCGVTFPALFCIFSFAFAAKMYWLNREEANAKIREKNNYMAYIALLVGAALLIFIAFMIQAAMVRY